MKYVAIIVAGGSGARMRSDLPKQFLQLNGRPVLMHTVAAFYYSTLKPEIIVVLNKEVRSYWENLCNEYQFKIPHKIVNGGETRFDSVKNGVRVLRGSECIVAIHDAARPVVTDQLITRCFEKAAQKGAVICAVSSRDSVRQMDKDRSRALDRETIYLVQTPQTFRLDILKKAYSQEYSKEFTDDASVVEKAGFLIHIEEGESANLKITYPEDLMMAEVLQKKSGLDRIE